MKSRYRVTLNGRNFLLDPSDREKKGFYVTRDVEAESLDDAEMKAVELVRGDEKITGVTANSGDDPPIVSVESIRPLGYGEESINGSGYIFYVEDSK